MSERAVRIEMYDNENEYSCEEVVFASVFHAKNARRAVSDAMMTLLDYGFIKNFNTDVLSEEETKEILKNA